MITVKHIRDTRFDENYDYIDTSFFYKIKRFVLFFALNLVAFPVCTTRHGLKIHGRDILKKHKKDFEDGIQTVKMQFDTIHQKIQNRCTLHPCEDEKYSGFFLSHSQIFVKSFVRHICSADGKGR